MTSDCGPVRAHSGRTPVRQRLTLRFPGPLESEFAAAYDESARRYRSELWLGLLISIGALLVFHNYLTGVPDSEFPFWEVFVPGVVAPMVLRWLSSSLSPVRRWSSAFYISAVYLDVAALTAARIWLINEDIQALPLIVPVAVLVSLVVVQIRFFILVPAVLIGLAGLFAAELTLLPAVGSNQLFDLAGAAILTLAPLALSYQLERTARHSWLQQRKLADLNRVDTLTQLPNRRRLIEYLTVVLDGVDRVTVAVLDLDDFKEVNDRHGHPVGDDYLRRIGSYLRQTARAPGVFAARLSGEEFVIVIDDPSGDRATDRVERIRAGIAGLSLPHPGGGVVTASAGCVLRSPTVRVPARELIEAADRALYAAKHSGRDCTRSVAEDLVRPDVTPASPLSAESVIRKLSAPIPLDSGPLEMRFPEPAESEFRAGFDATGIPLRRTIMIAIFVISGILLVIGRPLLELPEQAERIGEGTLLFCLMPASALCVITTLIPRLRRWSTGFYVAAIAVIIASQMAQRILVPPGVITVPFLMVISVLLSLAVVQIRFPILLGSMVPIGIGVAAAEFIAFPFTAEMLVTLVFGACMAGATLRFAYRLEQSQRLDWEQVRRLHRLVRTDPITGLPNRRRFNETAATMTWAPAGTALALFDIDHFKAYNDRYGHLAGDECLLLVGQAMADAAGEAPVARLSGEEFAVVLSDGDPVIQAERAERIRCAVEDLHVAGGLPGSLVTVSGGIAFGPGSGDEADQPRTGTWDELLRAADTALYSAKNSGRNRIAYAPPVGPRLHAGADEVPAARDIAR